MNVTNINEHVCERCGYTCEEKKHLVQHLKRKVPCVSLNSKRTQQVILHDLTMKSFNEANFQCEHCDKKFNTRQGKYQHLKKCQLRTESLSHGEGGNTLHSHNITNNTTTTSSHNTVTNNNSHNTNVVLKLNIRDFGHENMAALPDSAIRDNIMFLRFIDLLEMLHFDEDYPENRNFRLVSLKQELMEFYKNQKWYSVTLLTGIDDLIKHACRIFRNFYNSNKEDVKEDMGEEDTEKMLDDLEEISNCNKKYVKEIRKNMKALLHNYWKDK